MLEDILNANEYTATILSKQGPYIRGIITEGFGFSISHEFDSQFDLTKQQELSKLINKLKSFIGKEQSSFINVAQTVKLWMSGNVDSFNISILIPNCRPNYLKQKIQSLVEWAAPKIEDNQIFAPHNYAPSLKDLDASKGLLALRFSTYIKTGYWFVLQSCQVQFSNVIMDDGYPSYANVTFTLLPYRAIGANELKEMFL